MVETAGSYELWKKCVRCARIYVPARECCPKCGSLKWNQVVAREINNSSGMRVRLEEAEPDK